MSKRASPPILGAFIVGGLLLIAIALIVLGARGLLSAKSKLVLFFPGSVNGLQVGSPVKFKGVTVGQVSSIRIKINSIESAATIPVMIEVDDDLVATTTGEPLDFSNRSLVKAMVKRGLRGSLETESFLTGLLYVGLNVYTNAAPPTLVDPDGDLPEIPTIQTGLQKLAESLPKIERFLTHMESVASELQKMIGQVQAGEINDSVIATLAGLRRVLASPSLTNSLVSVEKMADEFRLTAADLRADLKPMMQQLNETAAGANKTVAELELVLQDARRLVGDNSPVVSQLVATLSDFQRTAVSLRQLSDYLARNPQSILTGRDRSNDHQP